MSRKSLLFSEDPDEETTTTVPSLFSTSTSTSGTTSKSSGGLANLFSTGSSQQEGNKNLTYQPPKQPSAAAQAPTQTTQSSQSQAPKKAVAAQQQQQQQQETAPALIFALPIQLFQFDQATSKFVSRGKVGTAILGNKIKFQLLLYLTNKEHLSLTNITPEFNFAIQNNVYGSFYDENRQNWSLLFRTQEECAKFAMYVAIARAASGEFKSVIQQEILAGPKGKGVTTGDTVRLKYTGYLCDNSGQLGSVFDSNVNDKDSTFRFRIGDGTVIKGWDEGIKGMKKGGKRIMVIPSDQGYGKTGAPPSIPPNSPLLFEVELVGVKRLDRERSNSITKQKEPALPSIDADDLPSNDELGNPVSDNANTSLVARMAKLGRPAMGGVMVKKTPAQEPEDQDEDETQTVPTSQPIQPAQQVQPIQPTQAVQPVQQIQPVQPVQPSPSPQLQPIQSVQPIQLAQPAQMAQPTPVVAPTGSPQQTPNQVFYQHPDSQYAQQSAQQYYKPNLAQAPQSMHLPSSAFGTVPLQNGQDYSYNPHSPYQQRDWRSQSQSNLFVNGPVDVAQVLLEERQLHQELKSNFANLTTTVQEIYVKMDRSNLFQAPGGKNDLSGLVLIQNIQRMVDENEKLKQDLNQKTEQVDTLREKITHLHEKNEKFIEENNRIMEQRNEALKESGEQTRKRLMELLEEKAKLERELNEASLTLTENNRQYSNLNRLYTAAKSELGACHEEIEKRKEENENLKNAKTASEQAGKELQSRLEAEKSARLQVQSNLESIQSELEKSKAEVVRLRKEVQEKELGLTEQMDDTQKNFMREKFALEESLQQLKESLEKQKRDSAIAIEQEVNRVQQQYKVILEQRETEQKEQVTRAMQDRKISELEFYDQGKQAGKEEAALRVAELEEEINNLKSKPTPTAASAPSPSPSDNQEDKAEAVKKIMNSVYFSLYEQFEEDESYSGDAVLKALMKTIKETTLKMLTKSDQEEAQEEEEGRNRTGSLLNQLEEEEAAEEVEEEEEEEQERTVDKVEENEDENKQGKTEEDVIPSNTDTNHNNDQVIEDVQESNTNVEEEKPSKPSMAEEEEHTSPEETPESAEKQTNEVQEEAGENNEEKSDNEIQDDTKQDHETPEEHPEDKEEEEAPEEGTKQEPNSEQEATQEASEQKESPHKTNTHNPLFQEDTASDDTNSFAAFLSSNDL